MKKLIGSDVIVAEKVIVGNSKQAIYSTGLSYLKSVVFYVKHVEILSRLITPEEVLQLLSYKTKIFKCGETKFRPNLCFKEILEKAPNLEVIHISNTNIKVNDSWPKDLLQLNSVDSLETVYLPIPDFNFNIKNLVDLMKVVFYLVNFVN
uniref:Uncharacterized protein n=1 Tax=Panagrolaimus davidi TaxID=227884 RepID=A0A914R192_9BILA